MTAGARPIPGTIIVDPSTNHLRLATLALIQGQLDGTQPFVRVIETDSRHGAHDLLPQDAEIERCVTTERALALTAEAHGGTAKVTSPPGSGARFEIIIPTAP